MVYSSLVNKQEVEQYFVPLIMVLQTGIEQKIIKNLNFDILTAFMYYPITVLANPSLSPDFELNEENIKPNETNIHHWHHHGNCHFAVYQHRYPGGEQF